MCSPRDPNIERHVLETHPYPIDFSNKPTLDPERPGSFGEEASRKQLITLLPPELWAEVFMYCVPDLPAHGAPAPWYRRDLHVNPSTAPLLLCQICRSWRQMALSLSALWQGLVVYVSMGTSYPSIELTRLWISRSGHLPLSLSLHQQNESNLNRLVAGRVLALFMKHIPRWMDIDLHLWGPRMALSLIPEKLNAPLLRRFNMRETSYRLYEKEEKCIFGIFEDVPRLSHLQLSRVPEMDLLGHSSVPVPWSQLVSLSLDYVPSIGTSLHLLSNCSNLRECTLKMDCLFGPIVDQPLLHTHLRSLSLNISYEHLSGFLSRITLPALARLKVHVRGPLEQYAWPQACFEQFLERSACVLTTLELHDSGMRVDQFVSTICHRLCQALEALLVEDRRDWTWDPFFTDVALDLLHCPRYRDAYSVIVFLDPGQGVGPDSDSDSISSTTSDQWQTQSTACFLPDLAKLAVRGNCSRTSDGAFASMVESRWYRREAGVAQLRSVKLDIPSGHFLDLQRLKVLQSEGLELDLSFTEDVEQ